MWGDNVRRERSRLRRLAIWKWAMFGACALLVAAWGASLWLVVRYDYYTASRTWVCVRLAEGNIESYRYTDFRQGPFNPPGGWSIERAGEMWWSGNFEDVSFAMIPLWWLLLAAALPTIVLWRRGRGFPPGHCEKCGYDLTGNVSGVCPECGVEVKQP